MGVIRKQEEGPFTVLVTGFGPFRAGFPVNPSWEIAKSLPSRISLATPSIPKPPPASPEQEVHNGTHDAGEDGKPEEDGFVNVVVHPGAIRVNYQTVRAIVPRLWEQPADVVLHIGMAGNAPIYQLERRGHRDGYDKPDVDGEFLQDDKRRQVEGDKWIWHGMPEELLTELDIEDVMDRWKAAVPQHKSSLKISDNAGWYLCDFIYFSSLSLLYRAKRPRQVLFLHVPSDATDEAIARGLELVVPLIKSIAQSELERRAKA